MRNGWKWVAAGLLLCGGLTWLVIGGGDGEPRCQGRSLRQWVQRCDDPDMREQARDAIICIVTNDATALVRLLDYDPTRRRDKQIRMIQKLPKFLYTTPFVYRWMFPEDSRELQSSAALSAFEIAGAHGEEAVPALTSLMLSASSESAGMNAAYALAFIGRAGRVPLEMNATNRESPARLFALQALPAAWGHPEEARKVIFAALTDPNPHVRDVASNAVVRYWPEWRGREFEER